MSELSELDAYWQRFLKETGRDEDDRCSGDLSFEKKGFNYAAELTLILTGNKTAFFSSFAAFNIDGEPLPVTDELYLVVDGNEKPQCVIQLESVEIVPFNEVTWEMAEREGEDENLEAWRERKQEDLEEEGDICGFEFSRDMKLIYQTFRIVFK